MMFPNRIVKLLSATCFLLAPIILAKAENKIILVSNREPDDSAKVSSLVGYFEKLRNDGENLEFSTERPKDGYGKQTDAVVNSADSVRNKQELSESSNIMHHSRETCDRVAYEDRTTVLTNALDEKQRQLDALRLKEKKSDVSLSVIREGFKQTKKSLDEMLMEMNEVKQTHRKEIESLSNRHKLELATVKEDLNAIRAQMEEQVKLISRLPSLLMETENKSKQKEQELSDRKRELSSGRDECDDRLNEMRSSYETKLSSMVAMIDEYKNLLAETKTSLSSCEATKKSSIEELKRLIIDKNDNVLRLEAELDKMGTIMNKFELEKQEEAKKKANLEEVNRRAQFKTGPPCPNGNSYCQVNQSKPRYSQYPDYYQQYGKQYYWYPN